MVSGPWMQTRIRRHSSLFDNFELLLELVVMSDDDLDL